MATEVIDLDKLQRGTKTDRLVAEALGCKIEYRGVVSGEPSPYDDCGCPNHEHGSSFNDGQCQMDHIKRFSTDLNDAFWAAEQVGLFKQYSLGWREVYNRWELSEFIPMDGPYEIATADTPAMAICKAILKLKNGK